MRPTFRKLEVRDLRDLETLITEHADSIEPGLRFIDSCILLGHARIDLVGLDANDTLVLMTLGFAGTEEMLLRVMEAYSWCLEYPDTVRRLYPAARFGRPPRVIFVAERLADSFVRKVKHLRVPELDCLTFLHLDVNGAAAVYFEIVARIRRSPERSARCDDGSSPYPDSLEQPPFIEGAAPDPNGQPNAALPAEHLSLATADPIDLTLLGVPPDPPEAEAGGPRSWDAQKDGWQEFFDRLGTVQLPNGRASSGIHDRINQFGPTD